MAKDVEQYIISGTPDLSVVIPHFEDHAGLERCLRALSNQRTSSLVEVIVVDNGSRDLPRDICRRFGATLLSQSKKGPGPARSTGARAAQGDVLAFVDADCLPAPDWVSTILQRFGDDPSLQILGGAIDIEVDGGRLPTPLERYEALFSYRQRLFVERDNYAATCNMAVRSSAFRLVGDFAGIDTAEDMDWGQRATAVRLPIGYVEDMRIATTARASFADLAKKLDRQMAHDYQRVTGLKGHLLWLLKACAMPLSPLLELRTVMEDAEMPGVADRLKVFGLLVRARLWRAKCMLLLPFSLNGRSAAAAWRTPTSTS
ncbi:MAG: glycosyltransferase family 2 protein [Pseudomonadota bacterium]